MKPFIQVLYENFIRLVDSQGMLKANRTVLPK